MCNNAGYSKVIMSNQQRKPDPRLAAFLFANNLLKSKFYDVRLSPAVNRFNTELGSRLAGGLTEKVFGAVDIDIAPQLEVRLYRPSAKIDLPVIIYYHGGGWVVGSIDSHDNICRKLANRASAIVIAVGYRLAPENKFPSAVEDAYTALQWAHTNARSFGGRPDRIAVCGDSAVGNLAAVTCLVSRDMKGPNIAFQALVYPATDASNLDTESYRLSGRGYYLTKPVIQQVIPLYVNSGNEVLNPYVSPLLASDLGGLPPALVVTAEFDPLLSEGEAYVAKLAASGVPCRLHRYAGMIHGFLSFGGFIHQSNRAIGEIAAAITEAVM